MASEILNMSKNNLHAVYVHKTLISKMVSSFNTEISSSAKSKSGWEPIRCIQSPISSLCHLQMATDSTIKSKLVTITQSFSVCHPIIHVGEIFVAQVPLPALASYGSPLWVAFHTTPLVSLHIRVKSEDFVYPPWVESNINKKRWLWWGTFCPLDAHTNYDFALMFLANQWATVVPLQEQNKERLWISNNYTKASL